MTSTQRLELDFPTALRQRTVWVLLAMLLVWSFSLRLWYATPSLDSTRFWDERYGLENLEPLLKEGRLRPVHGFHPGFSYLPHGLALKTSELLSRATGWDKLAIFDDQGRYTPSAYMICRTISVLFGTSTLFLLFLIGRRLGGDRLGLLAAFLLSVVPWHLRQSVLFKADIALLFTVVLTFYLSLRAIEKPSIRSFVATGLAIGLALSSKFNAGPVAVPVTVGAFLSQRSRRRALVLLVAAAAVSVLVFLALQPYVLIDPDIYRRSMNTTSRVYERVAERKGHGRLYLFWHLVQTLVSSSFHGPLIGTLAVVGLGSLAFLSVRHRRDSKVALPWLMALSYLITYVALYALATPRPSPHNWLPISPFASLGAAWGLLAGGLSVRQRIGPRRWRIVSATVMVFMTGYLGWQASRYTYRETVPRTGDRVLEFLNYRAKRVPGQHICSEYDFGIKFYTRHRMGRLAIQTIEELGSHPAMNLNLCDAEVFLASKLQDPSRGGFYRDRTSRIAQRDVVVIEPSFAHAWGPQLVVLTHPYRPTGESQGTWVRSQSDPLVFVPTFADEDLGRRLSSIVFHLPRKTVAAELTVGGQRVPIVTFRGPRRNWPRTSGRFRATGEIRLRMSRADGKDSFSLTLKRWRKGK